MLTGNPIITGMLKGPGKILVDRMKEETWDTWLDVGCGDNKYKPYFGDKVTGIDPHNEHADIVVSCLDFEPTPYDIVTAMGSTQTLEIEQRSRQK